MFGQLVSDSDACPFVHSTNSHACNFSFCKDINKREVLVLLGG